MSGRTHERGVSTVLDVTLFVLLVSAAVLSVVTAGGGPTDDPAAVGRDEATVETLATATTTVHYEIGVENGTDDPITRVGHGTLAELLAEAALANVTVDGTRVSPYAGGFTTAVADAVRPVLDGRTQVAATWTPYPGSSLRGRVAVGPAPPADATVHAATLAIDSGVPAARDPAVDVAANAATTDTGYDRVAEVVSRRTVDGLFPPRRTHTALDGDAVDAGVTRATFDRMASAYGSEATLDSDARDGDVAGDDAARFDLSVAVANRTSAELRERFESPEAAAASVETGRVTVVVRTWS
ncbi:DUF7284 family protein [Salinigranum sp. GCM10025319]|uniref:DUF7284 family protein n=1 Tax=Salinigranum sp. GCM10025319 TaxID=3252687 RepID=UPI0036119882